MTKSNASVGKILSVCVSMAKPVAYKNREVMTGIFKKPVEGKIALRKLNLDGDEQADLTVHGGPDKALYIYASEHYPFWKNEMPERNFAWGEFGENLTTTGLLETEVCIGDEFRMGTAVVRVSQPRLPCYKLGIRFGTTDIIKRFMRSRKSGIYFSVVEEGELAKGDDITFLRSDEHRITVHEVADLFVREQTFDKQRIHQILNSNLANQMKMFVSSLLDEEADR